MKRSLLIGLGILFCASMAFGQAGGIGLYVDHPGYTQCNYDDTGPALVPVYVVHKLCPGATASGWMVVEGGGFNCTYAGEIACGGMTHVGSSQTGIACPYGGCFSSNVLIATIHYFCAGASPACAYLEVVPSPRTSSGTIEVWDCNSVRLAAVGGKLFFNDDGTCGRACGLSTKTTSWGKVKAMYR